MQQNFLCPQCSNENMPGSAYCFKCGTALGVLGYRDAVCTNCGFPRMPAHRFCGNCGIPMEPLCLNCGNKISADSRYCPKCSFFCGGGRSGLK